jgi:HD-like signal output (HDOD) protein
MYFSWVRARRSALAAAAFAFRGRQEMNASVLESIKKSAAVPSMPQVVLRFLEIMQDPEFDYADLVKVLSADPGTVGELLRLANSALFGVRNKVVSTRQALTLLGPKRVRSLLLGRYLVDTMTTKKVFWRRSLTSSLLASHLANEKIRPHRDEAFIGALLADIGIPILAEAMPQQYAPALARFAPGKTALTAEEETQAVELTHGEVSAMVLGHWTLPKSICAAVNLHQSQNPGTDDIAIIARILNASDRIGALLCTEPDEDTVVECCTDAMQFVGIDVGVLIKLLPTVEADVEELADALRIDVLPSKAYAAVARALTEWLRGVAIA